jgi:outer membrane biogenesis lipoprotein LolB
MSARFFLRVAPLAALLLAACAPEVPPAAAADDIQRAVDRAERELASAKAAAAPVAIEVTGS